MHHSYIRQEIQHDASCHIIPYAKTDTCNRSYQPKPMCYACYILDSVSAEGLNHLPFQTMEALAQGLHERTTRLHKSRN